RPSSTSRSGSASRRASAGPTARRPRAGSRAASSTSAITFWPTAQFIDPADLNRQAQAWTVSIANVRQHGTTGERPAQRLTREQAHLLPVPHRERVQPFLRDDRIVGRDGFVAWERAWYGVPWRWAGKTVHVAADVATVEIWGEAERLAVHPRPTRPGQRVILPGHWGGPPRRDGRRSPSAVSIPPSPSRSGRSTSTPSSRESADDRRGAGPAGPRAPHRLLRGQRDDWRFDGTEQPRDG